MKQNLINNSAIEMLFDTRFTAKGYDPERAVSDRDFQTILHAGRMSPSSLGLEPWKVVRIKDRQLLEDLAPIAWGGAQKFPGASHTLVLLCRTPQDLRWDSDYVRHVLTDIKGMDEVAAHQRAEVIRDFVAGDLGVKTDEQLYAWGVRQVYIMLGNMLTTAAALGVDSTPIEGFQVENVHKLLTERGVYDGDHFRPAVMACFGYASTDPLPKSRAAIEDYYSEF